MGRFYGRNGTRNADAALTNCDAGVIAAMIDALVFDLADQWRPGDEARVGNWRGIIKENQVREDTVQMRCARMWIE
jgi:hypothetical protein